MRLWFYTTIVPNKRGGGIAVFPSKPPEDSNLPYIISNRQVDDSAQLYVQFFFSNLPLRTNSRRLIKGNIPNTA